jgi:uncharacterized membrane protein YtjA (UPF0391 family)
LQRCQPLGEKWAIFGQKRIYATRSGGLVHILLVLALIVIVVNLVQSRRR